MRETSRRVIAVLLAILTVAATPVAIVELDRNVDSIDIDEVDSVEDFSPIGMAKADEFYNKSRYYQFQEDFEDLDNKWLNNDSNGEVNVKTRSFAHQGSKVLKAEDSNDGGSFYWPYDGTNSALNNTKTEVVLYINSTVCYGCNSGTNLHGHVKDNSNADIFEGSNDIINDYGSDVSVPTNEWLKVRATNVSDESKIKVDITVVSTGKTKTIYRDGGFGNKWLEFDYYTQGKLFIDELQIREQPLNHIKGTVTDKDGNVVEDANITVKSTGDTTTTNSSGYYTKTLDNGTYTIQAENPSTGSTTEKSVTVSGGETKTLDFTLGSTISGTVVDQNGNPVEDATVEIIGVDFAQITPKTGQTDTDRAKELLDKASDPLPDSWDPDRDLTSSTGLYETTESEYVAIHSYEDWGLERWTNQADLDQPLLNPPAEDRIVLSAWDPEKGGVQGPIDRQLPGATIKRDFVVERLDAFGDVIESKTYSPDTIRRRQGLIGKDHRIAIVTLPAGVYRVKIKGSDVELIVLVGDEDQVISTFSTKLKNKADRISDAADYVDSRVNSGKFSRLNTTTDSNGDFSIKVTGNVKRVGIQAYKADGKIIATLNDPSIQKLRTVVRDKRYNGSIWLTREPKMVDVTGGKSGITVETHKFSTPPFYNLDDFKDRFEDLRDEIVNSTLSKVSQLLDTIPTIEDADDLRDQVDSIADLVRSLRESNQEFRKRSKEEWEDRDEDVDDALDEIDDNERTIEELREDAVDLSSLIGSVEDELSAGEPESDVTDNGRVTVRQGFDGDFSEDDVSVLWQDFNGTSYPIDSDYWSVNKRAGLTDEVVVDEYPIPNSSDGGTVGIFVASEDGRLGRSTETATSPDFAGELPDIRSVDLSSIRPGVGETVTIDPNLAGSKYTFVNATIVDETGSTVATGVTNEEASFTPNSTGVYWAKMEFNDSDDTHTFTETIKIAADSNSNDHPPTVRFVEGKTGRYMLAGDGIDDAKTDVSADGNVETTIMTAANETPNEVHVYLDDAPSNTRSVYSIRVVKGDSIETATSLQRHIGVYLHTNRLEEAPGTIVYRKGQVDDQTRPIITGADTKGGIRTDNTNGTTIETYTDTDGAVDVIVDANPDWLDRQVYRGRAFFATTSLPAVGTVFLSVVPESTDIGIGDPVFVQRWVIP